MKIRKVRVGIKDLETALNEFVETGRALEKGKPVKKEKGVYFTSIEAFRKAVTPKRIELLKGPGKNALSHFRLCSVRNYIDKPLFEPR